MDSTKFMVSKTNDEGVDQAIERWEFLSFFQDNFLQSEKDSVIEWYHDAILNTADPNFGESNKVQLKTVHGCKGQSLPIVMYLSNKMFNTIFINTDEDIESEMFVLYVALTRAEKVMKIYHNNPSITRLAFLFEGVNTTGLPQRQVVTTSPSQAKLKANYMAERWKYSKRLKEEARIIKTTDKAVQFDVGGGMFWVPYQFAAYDGQRYYISDWIVSKNSLYKFCG